MKNLDAITAARDALDYAVFLDEQTIRNLFNAREATTEEMADKSAMICSADPDGIPTLAPLGIINGVLESATGYRLAAVVEEETGKIRGIEIYDPETKQCV